MPKLDWRRASRYQPEATPARFALPVDFFAAQYRPRKKKTGRRPGYTGPRLPEKIADVCEWLDEA